MTTRNTFKNIFGSHTDDDEINSTSHQTDGTQTNSVSSDRSTNDFENKIQTSIAAFNNAVFVQDEIFPKPNYDFGPTVLQSISANEKKYDPYDYGNTEKSIAFCDTMFHLIFMSMGPGLFSVPLYFMNVGYVTGFVSTILIVILYAHSIRSMVRSEYEICKLKRIPNMSYPEVVYYAFNNGPAVLQWFAPFGKYLSSFIFLAVWFGGGCYGLVLISQFLQTAYNNLFLSNASLLTILKIIFLPVFLLCSIRRLYYLIPISILGSIICNSLFLLVIYYAVADTEPWNFGDKFVLRGNLSLFLGAVLFNLNITGLIIPLKNDMRNPRQFSSRFGVLNTSYTLIGFSYTLFFLICGLKYGVNLRDNIIENLPADEGFVQIIFIFTATVLILQFPLGMYIIIDIIWNNILKKVKENTSYTTMWEFILRIVVVLLGFILAYSFPNISLFLSFSGTVCSSIDSLIFPSLVQTLVMWKTSRSRSKFILILIKNTLIVIIGFILVITGIKNCVHEISS